MGDGPMGIPLDVLDDILIASPCDADWALMTGTEQVRFCGACKLNVYNISEMTRDAAIDRIMRAESDLPDVRGLNYDLGRGSTSQGLIVRAVENPNE